MPFNKLILTFLMISSLAKAIIYSYFTQVFPIFFFISPAFSVKIYNRVSKKTTLLRKVGDTFSRK